MKIILITTRRIIPFIATILLAGNALLPVPARAAILFLTAPLTVEATGATGATVDFSGFATDTNLACSGLAVSPATALLAIGTTVATLSAIDSCGSASANVTVHVQDTTPPSITIPNFLQTIVLGSSPVLPTISDLVTNNTDLLITYSVDPFTLGLGDHIINVAAKDSFFNQSTASFEVDVVSDEAVPEPATVALFTLGFVGIAIGRRRFGSPREPLSGTKDAKS